MRFHAKHVVAVSFPLAFLVADAVPPPEELYAPLTAQKLHVVALNAPDRPVYPQYTNRVRGVWQFSDAGNTWTTGFFPATLYALDMRRRLCPQSESVAQVDWLGLARQWAAGIVPFEVNNGYQHDVGFVSFPFQYELDLNAQNQTAVGAINNFAAGLARRFSPVVGCTRSWDTADPTNFQVIIDNMMNLELLFMSASLTHNDTLREIAISHADRTIRHHVRSDGSSFHVVEYNSTTGDVIRRRTAQGFSDSSTWTRGQAWGIYGFAQMFQHTGQIRYLRTARRMADFFLDSIPSNGIVPWDFNAPLSPPRPADSSASTIAATGLLLLSRLEQSLSPPNNDNAREWSDAALHLLANVTTLAWRPSWQSLLSNGTVNNPANPPNNLTGTIYGDYYFVKAGNDLISMGLAECSAE